MTLDDEFPERTTKTQVKGWAQLKLDNAKVTHSRLAPKIKQRNMETNILVCTGWTAMVTGFITNNMVLVYGGYTFLGLALFWKYLGIKDSSRDSVAQWEMSVFDTALKLANTIQEQEKKNEY